MNHIHLLGIGGIGMSALARILKKRGVAVSGSDCKASAITQALEQEGISVDIGETHMPQNATIAFSSAIRSTDRTQDAIHRSVLLAQLADGYNVMAVTGTHGKTTTSALLTWVLQTAGRDPSYALGGMLQNTNGHHGTGTEFIIEADESDGSFLNYHPQTIILTSTDTDHLDYWHTPEKLKQAYATFVARAKTCIWCRDDVHIPISGISYGFHPESQYCITRYRPGYMDICVDDPY